MDDMQAISSIVSDVTLTAFMLFVLVRVDTERRELLRRLLDRGDEERGNPPSGAGLGES